MSNKFQSQSNALLNLMLKSQTLNDRIGVDTSDTPLSLTALLRNQKDIIDNKLGQIASSLDKDTPNSVGDAIVDNIKGDIDSINTTLASGVAVKGNDSGTPTLIKCDANGVVAVSNVSSQNIIPANNSNSHITDDPDNSLAVGLKARTTIGTATTETFLRCSDTGASIHNEEMSTPEVSNESMTIATGNSDHFNIDCGNHKSLGVVGTWTGGSQEIQVWFSADNSNYFYSSNNSAFTTEKDGVYYFSIQNITDLSFRYVRIRVSNNSGSTHTLSSIISLR